MTKSPIHLLIRFSDTLLKEKDTIEAHNQVVEQAGCVWFGKMGSPVSQNNLDSINTQLEEGVPTYCYLVKGNRRKSVAYRAKIIAATNTYPEGQVDCIPAYYFDLDLIKYMKLWVKLDRINPITIDELNKMRVRSSVLPLGETLVKSSTGHFFLVEDKHLY